MAEDAAPKGRDAKVYFLLRCQSLILATTKTMRTRECVKTNPISQQRSTPHKLHDGTTKKAA
jgi:hypothetical protein